MPRALVSLPSLLCSVFQNLTPRLIRLTHLSHTGPVSISRLFSISSVEYVNPSTSTNPSRLLSPPDTTGRCRYLCTFAMGKAYLPAFIFLRASSTDVVLDTVSGCGVMTRSMWVSTGSNPAAKTRRTTSLLVNIPAIWVDSCSKTKTAVLP